jgi:hypothetical protein
MMPPKKMLIAISFTLSAFHSKCSSGKVPYIRFEARNTDKFPRAAVIVSLGAASRSQDPGPPSQ